jgi:hypothetical protein
MSDNNQYSASAGYMVLGILMLMVAGFCMVPDTVSTSSMNNFRFYGGIALMVLGIISAAVYKDGFSAFIIIINGLLFILAAKVSLASFNDFPMLVFAVSYILLALVSLLNSESKMLITIAMIFIALNVIARYIMGSADDGTNMVSGIFCLLSSAVFVYVSLAMMSDRFKLPLV